MLTSRVLLWFLVSCVQIGAGQANIGVSSEPVADSGNPVNSPPVDSPIQSCVDSNHPNILVYSMCRDVVANKSIAVQANLTTFEDYVGKTFRSLIYVRDQECRQSIVNFACSVYYPLCDKLEHTLRCPCMSVLHTVHTACDPIRDPYGAALANYSISLLHNASLDGRPCGNLSSTGPGFGPCRNPDGASGAIQCPPELVNPDVNDAREVYISASNGPDWPFGPKVWPGGNIEVCKSPCNPSLFDTAESHTSVIIVTTLAWISTFASGLLFGIFHLSSGKALHAWPERLQVYFTTCVFFLSLSLTFGSMIEFSDSMWCEHQSLCTAQAALLEYFGLALAMWWLLICFNLFLSIVVYRKEGNTNEDIQTATKNWEKYYHGFAWGVPAFFTLILAYDKKLGYPVYGTPSYCWITDEDSSVWEFTFFFIEILAIVLVGMVFFGASLHQLRRLTSSEYTMWALIRNISMVITFIFAFAFTFTFMGIYQITLTSQEDDDRNAYDEYIQCVVKRWWQTSQVPHDIAQCVLSSHPDLVFMDIQSACFASMGIVTFLVFGSPHFGTVRYQLKRSWSGSFRQSSTGSVVKDPNDAMEQLIDTQEGLGHLNVSGENQAMSPAVIGQAGGLSPELHEPDTEAGSVES